MTSEVASSESTPQVSAPAILVVDDERSMREFLSIMLRKEGLLVANVDSGEAAIEKLDAGERFAVVITDLKMASATGLDVLRHVKALDPACQVVVMTAYATTDTAVSAIKQGAYDYLSKPFKVDDVRLTISRALDKHHLLKENVYLKEIIDNNAGYDDLIGTSEVMRRVYQLISRVAPTRTTILIHGESGTGKELVAHAIHRNSAVAKGPFIPINCGAIPRELVESELFGHVKGSFTGAVVDKKGLFEAAQNGTIFLDEIGELPLDMQVRLLRVLQERRIKPIGSSAEKEVNCRVVAATNRDLREEVATGRFREDLYYRLNIITIDLPPLRARAEDKRLLLEHFLRQFAADLDSPVSGIAAPALRILMSYEFPGNVRELQNIVERAVTLEPSPLITVESLPYHLQEAALTQVSRDVEIPEGGLDLEAIVEQLERELITKALERSKGVKTEAAGLLGISFRSLRYRLEKYGMNDD